MIGGARGIIVGISQDMVVGGGYQMLHGGMGKVNCLYEGAVNEKVTCNGIARGPRSKNFNYTRSPKEIVFKHII